MITYDGGVMILLEDLAVKDDADLEAFFVKIAPEIARRMAESRQSKVAGSRDSATFGGTYNSNGSWSATGSYTWNF
jgi:hypothetical protein